MSLFVTDFLILDTAYLVAANPCNGDGPHDGRYGLHLVLDVNGQAKRLYVDAPSQAARDAAFTSLVVHLHREAAEGLTLDFGDEGETR